MTTLWERCSRLSDGELIAALKSATAVERRALASLLVHLSEFETRELALHLAYPSLYIYCTQELRYSEDAAYKRIRAARVVRRFPAALELLEKGDIHLAGLVLLAPFLDEENHRGMLGRAIGKSKREIEVMAAEFEPRAPRPDSVRRFSTPAPQPPGPSPELRLSGFEARGGDPPSADWRKNGEDGADVRTSVAAVPSGTSAGGVPGTGQGAEASLGARISFDADDEFLARLERARQVVRHKHPQGRLRDVFSEALEALLDNKDMDRRTRRLAAKRERSALKKGGRLAPGPVQ